MASGAEVSYDKQKEDIEGIVPDFGPGPNKPPEEVFSKLWSLPVMTCVGLSRREVVFAGCLAVLLVLVLVLAILLGVLATGKPAPSVLKEPCSDPGCLQATSYLLGGLNTSAKPCDDFYSYACGGWMQTHPIAPANIERTVYQDIYNQNAEKLRRLLDTPISPDFSEWLADQKLKTFYKACLDDFENTKQRGLGLLEAINKVEGWYVLGNQPGSAETWDPETALKAIQLDYWSTTWFRLYMTYNHDDPTGVLAQMDYSGLTFPFSCYLAPEGCAMQLDAYRNFLKTIARLLANDAGVNDTQVFSRIDTFVQDVIDVETMLANITQTRQRPPNPAQRDNKISLADLRIQTQMNWVDFFQFLFPSANVDGSFQVVLYEQDYVQKVAQYIQSFGPKKRPYHNYLIWRLIQTYVLELSWDYVHAYRIFYEAALGRSEFPEKWKVCFEMAHQRMRWALSSLYVRDHFADTSKDMAEEVAARVKSVTSDSLSQVGWIDAETLAKAKNKIDTLVDQIGYPDWMLNSEKMNLYYAGLELNASNHFGNMVNTSRFEKELWNRRLANQVLRTEWDIDVYGISAHYLYNWNELLFPAGLLQFPVFASAMPRWMVYGGMGSIFGEEVINSVDEYGGRFDRMGQPNDWWTDQTKQDYTQRKTCVSDYWDGFSIRYNGREVAIQGSNVAVNIIAEMGGLRQAFYAYKDWVQESGEEKLVSSLDITADQAFFIAYAQSNCAVNTDTADIMWVRRLNVPQDLRVRGTLTHLKEFHDTFKCQPGDQMYREERCDVF